MDCNAKKSGDSKVITTKRKELITVMTVNNLKYFLTDEPTYWLLNNKENLNL